MVKVGGDKGKGVGRRINITLRAFKADAATSAPAGSAAQRSTASHGSGSPGGSGGPAAKRQRT